MQAIHKLIPLLLMATSAHVVAQGSSELSYTAETYGFASGDLPIRGLGLVLELVDGSSEAPKLRLFGGPAGHPASISISADSDSARTPQGAKRLIGDSNTVHEGSFDWMGYYEVPLEGPLTEGAQFFAQGTHVGIFDLAGVGQALTQNSNGLQVHVVAPTDTPISVGEFRPHLPQEQAELPGTAGLAERLQRCLNSNGDSTKISLYVEGNGGAGANVGGQGSMEILVQRTSEGTYEVILAADLAVKA
ncbi:MAG: hypothetical protein JKY61_01975, partial [Planctomycetes bacterium]|nr:hypothetical protein [Planctomycetota bacterium]